MIILAIIASTSVSLLGFLVVVSRDVGKAVSLGGLVETAMGVIRRGLITIGPLMLFCSTLLGFACLTRAMSIVSSFIESG